ncbi:MAG: hypothetical protein H0W86_00385 [Armatimonadetes bacterium]|nr:hypothetical protein [Armatimonadota bacterium]
MQPVRKSRVGLYIALIAIALIVIAGIAIVVVVTNFLKSPEGQRLQSAIGKTERLEDAMPNLVQAFQRHNAEKGDFPATVEVLTAYGLTAGNLETINGEMKYTKPAKDAPPETVILDSGTMDFIQKSEVRVQVTKDLNAFKLTKSPIGKGKGSVEVKL